MFLDIFLEIFPSIFLNITRTMIPEKIVPNLFSKSPSSYLDSPTALFSPSEDPSSSTTVIGGSVNGCKSGPGGVRGGVRDGLEDESP